LATTGWSKKTNPEAMTRQVAPRPPPGPDHRRREVAGSTGPKPQGEGRGGPSGGQGWHPLGGLTVGGRALAWPTTWKVTGVVREMIIAGTTGPRPWGGVGLNGPRWCPRPSADRDNRSTVGLPNQRHAPGASGVPQRWGDGPSFMRWSDHALTYRALAAGAVVRPRWLAIRRQSVGASRETQPVNPPPLSGGEQH